MRSYQGFPHKHTTTNKRLEDPLIGAISPMANRGKGGVLRNISLLFVFVYTERTFGLEMGCITTKHGTGLGFSKENKMNVLALIQAKQKKVAAINTAHKVFLVYRGVPYTKFA
mgnify:CR=1 FL=1